MVVALKPLHDIARIKRVVVATYQSVSGAGKEAMDELFEHTKAIYMNDRKEPVVFTKAIPFNVIPQIDVFLEDGATKEEWKMVVETRKILDPKIDVIATCVRVPVFVGHAEAVNVEFESALERRRGARDPARGRGRGRGRRAGGEFITPAECVGEYAVFVSRIRKDPTVPLRSEPVGGLGQSAQGCRPERGPDRRGHGRGRADLAGQALPAPCAPAQGHISERTACLRVRAVGGCHLPRARADPSAHEGGLHA